MRGVLIRNQLAPARRTQIDVVLLGVVRHPSLVGDAVVDILHFRGVLISKQMRQSLVPHDLVDRCLQEALMSNMRPRENVHGVGGALIDTSGIRVIARHHLSADALWQSAGVLMNLDVLAPYLVKQWRESAPSF